MRFTDPTTNLGGEYLAQLLFGCRLNPVEHRQRELEDTDPSAVDLLADRDVGCLQPIFKQRTSKGVKENYRDVLLLK